MSQGMGPASSAESPAVLDDEDHDDTTRHFPTMQPANASVLWLQGFIWDATSCWGQCEYKGIFSQKDWNLFFFFSAPGKNSQVPNTQQN